MPLLAFGIFVKRARKHSSRMRIARLLTVYRSIPCISGGGGICQPPNPQMQTPCRYSHPLDADSSYLTNPSPHEQNDTCVKTLPCHKLRLVAVNMQFSFDFSHSKITKGNTCNSDRRIDADYCDMRQHQRSRQYGNNHSICGGKRMQAINIIKR